MTIFLNHNLIDLSKMFSISGLVIKGTEKKNGVILSISKEQYEKIVEECKTIAYVFPDSNQPIYPAWSYDNEYYCKVLLSKARKDQFSTLMARDSEGLLSVRVMPYAFDQANSGSCNGYSLYYQGEFNVPKKFRKVVPSLEATPTVQ